MLLLVLYGFTVCTTFILFMSIYYILFGLNNTISTSTWKTEKNKPDASYRSFNILYSKFADSKIYAIYTILTPNSLRPL